MKITNKEIEEIMSLVIGEDITPLVNILRNKSNVSEFKLADELNITVNQVRNMLYRLYKHNLVSFVRKKDKKKGWYIYYWTLDLKHVREELLKLKTKRVEEFKSKLDAEEGGTFFMCPNKCMRVKLENAMEFGFRCQECGNLLVEQNNNRTIENLRQRIKELEEELKKEEEEEMLANAKKMRALAKKSVKEVAKKPVKKVAKKPVKEVAKKPVKEVAKKPPKKPVKKVVKKPVKKRFTLKSLGKKLLRKVKKR
ncbi:MAG: hypothetical protein ABIB71_09090 [Candidatus Woesearchaeota archaeon]